MKKLVLLFLFTALAMTGLTVQQSAAQDVERGAETLYLRPHVGISYYMGDNERSPFNFDGDMFDKFPYNVGLELGYQFTSTYSLGLAFRTGDYTQITDFEVPTSTEDHPTTRSAVQLIARGLLSEGKIAPYWMAGLNVGWGETYVFSTGCANNVAGACETKSDNTAFGATIGFGLDFYINPSTSFFLQTALDAQAPDGNPDGSVNDGFGVDWLGQHTAGIKFNLKRIKPVELTDMVCPAEVVDAGSPVSFTASHNENASTPVMYSWTFGDGSSAQGMTATHTFDRAGDYTVGVRAKNGNGKYESTMSCTVSVKDPCIPAAITSMRASNMNPDTQTSITFSANVTGTDGEWRWDFGDGSTGTGMNPSHTYDEPGTYTVTLEVENCAGVTRRTMTITVDPYEAAICREITEMNSAFFDRNSSAITEEGRAALQENLDILLECPNLNVRVEGWASPGERRPQELSEDRARAVEQFYVDAGVPASRIMSSGMGRSQSGSKKEGLAQFRRVDTIPVR